MDITLLDFADFVSSLSIILMLSVIYGAIRRKTAARVLPQLILGALFGCVAILEMHRPIEPFDGVLIDMRNVPIALAGAFLGRAGLIVCLSIAIAQRVTLGGEGAFAGTFSMLIAGGMGYLWHHLTLYVTVRGLLSLLVLAAMMSTHIIGAVFLPPQSYFWFFHEAAAPLVALNMLTVPLAAWMLEHQRRLTQSHEHRAARSMASHTGRLNRWKALLLENRASMGGLAHTLPNLASAAARVTPQQDLLFRKAALLMAARRS